jgi:hypothetical protein
MKLWVRLLRRRETPNYRKTACQGIASKGPLRVKGGNTGRGHKRAACGAYVVVQCRLSQVGPILRHSISAFWGKAHALEGSRFGLPIATRRNRRPSVAAAKFAHCEAVGWMSSTAS